MKFRTRRTFYYLLLVFVSIFLFVSYMNTEYLKNDVSFGVARDAWVVKTMYNPSEQRSRNSGVINTDGSKSGPHSDVGVNVTWNVDVRAESKCGYMTCPVHLALDDTWGFVDKDRSGLVFSAFYQAGSSTVVLIGSRVRSRRHAGGRYVCQSWVRSENSTTGYSMQESPVTAIDMPEHHGKGYAATQFHCNVPSKTMPLYVSMVTKSCRTPIHLVRVRSTVPPVTGYKRRFTVCLMPLYFHYDRADQLVEWIEFNRILGAQRFTVYNYTTSVNVDKVLKYYSERGLAEVVNWRIPLALNTQDKDRIPDIHYYGQVVALQECLYRNKLESEFVVNLDLDEFIVPRAPNISSWSEMVAALSKTTGAYIFRNTFFKKEWNDTTEMYDNKSLAEKYRLVTLLKTKHEKKVSTYRQRSKYIAKTAIVDRLMIHDVPGLRGPSQAVLVPMETGMLHHYRNWFQYKDPEHVKVSDNIVVDRYGSKLIKAVDTVWKALPDVPFRIKQT